MNSRIHIYTQLHNLQSTAWNRTYFWHRYTKEVFIILCLGQGENCYIQWDCKFLVYTHINTHTATIGTVISTLKIPPRHNGVVPIKISGPLITTHMAYFLTDDSTPKGRDPNINIIDGIHKIKDRTSVNILVSNYTNKHLTFHKGEYMGHLKPLVLDSTDQKDIHHTNSVTLKKMMSETITPDTFNPAQHELSAAVQDNLKLLLQEYESQFTKDETTIGTTPLTSMTIDTGTTDPVSQKPYPIAMKHYQWVKEEVEKLPAAKVICTSCSSWSAPIIVVPKRQWRKTFSKKKPHGPSLTTTRNR